MPLIAANVRPHSTIHTDELIGYDGLGMVNRFTHLTVNHSAGEYVSHKTGATVNGIEGFWAQLKRGINGTHIHVSPKHLAEFEFRYNRPQFPQGMLDEMMFSFRR